MTQDSIPLREYMESRFQSLQRAVDKAEEASDRRFAGVNEMRSMVTDAAASYLTRTEYESGHQALVEKVESLQKMLWIGLGALLALQFLISILVVFWRVEK
jgi:predicted neutral ceramidase superfamily lipid hydrolase